MTALLTVLLFGLAAVTAAPFERTNMGYGGGVSFSSALDPYNARINYATNVQFGYGVDAGGIKQANTISNANSLGNAGSMGNAFGGAQDGFGYGGGQANTRANGGLGYIQGQTNNIGFSGSSGNGFGQGGAMGQVYGR